MNVSVASKAVLVKALANLASQGPQATHAFAEVVRQLNLLAEDVISDDSDTTVSSSDDVESLSRVAFSLASSSESSQKLVGVVLLQILVEECSSQRFLQTFPNCGTKLLLVLKAAATDEIQRSTWATLRSLFVRISQMLELPGVRQEGAALAGKLAGALGPIIKRKQGDAEPVSGNGAAVEVEALEALAAALAAVPTAFRSHLKQLGQFAGDVLCGEHSSAALRAAASHCISLLPHVTGQAEQWSDAVQDVLASVHLQLNTLYLGLEDAAAAKMYRATFKPDARGLQAGGDPAGTIQNAQMVVVARKRLAALLDCLERLLTQPAPTPVPVPGNAVLQLCARILSVDESLVQAGRASPSAAAYTELLAVLPGMHAAAAKLLQLLLEVGGGTLLPLHKTATRLLADCLRRLAADPPLFLATSSWLVRREVYTCAAALMRVGGWGPVRDLAAPVMQCMLLELYSVAPAGAAQAPKGGGSSKQAKKRKRAKAEDDLAGISSGSALLASAHGLKSHSPAVDMRNAAAQVAALTLVEELYKVGGAILGLEARAQMDAAVAHQAATAAAGCERASRSGAPAPRSMQAVRLAAMRALLASVLAPCSHRPPFIAQALHFFRQGLTSADAELRAFCVGALLVCEAFVHPRSQSPWPAARSAGSVTNNAVTPSTDYLGLPRMWSAVSPVTATPDFQKDTMQQQISQQDRDSSQQPMHGDIATSAGAAAREADAKAQPLPASEPAQAQHAVMAARNSNGVDVLKRREPSTTIGTAAIEEAGGLGKGTRELATAPAAEAQQVPAMVPVQRTLAGPASLLAVQQPPVVHEFSQAAGSTAKASISVPQSVATAGQEDMSSDSEGSLPSIDTGSAGSQSSDSDEEMVS